MSYKHLTKTDRFLISAFIKKWFSQKCIALELGFSKSTISREINRNSIIKNWTNKKEYLPEDAQRKTLNKRRFSKYQCMKIEGNLELSNYIKQELKRKDVNLSPKTIAYEWNMNKKEDSTITHESIYKWLNTSYWIEYKSNLLYKKGYKKTQSSKWSKIRNRIMIEERDKNEAIKNRTEKWHFEWDLIVSPLLYKGAVLTIIDRYTRIAKAWKIKDKSSENIMKLIASSVEELGIKTITFDNWMEFAKHEILRKIWVKTYFCHSYCSWQKWSIENFNRLLRRIYPKWTNFDKITQEQIKSATDIINNTPREILGFISPKKAHF